MKGPDHLFHVYDQINGKQAILSSIYLQINGGSLFPPHIDYIFLKGFDAGTNAAAMQKTKPSRSPLNLLYLTNQQMHVRQPDLYR